MDGADGVSESGGWEAFTYCVVELVGEQRCEGIICMGDMLGDDTITILGASVLEPLDGLGHHRNYKKSGCMRTGMRGMREGGLVGDVMEGLCEGVPC